MEIQKILFSAWASCLLVITAISIVEYKIVSAARSFSSYSHKNTSLLYGNHILPTYNNNSASVRNVFGVSLFENNNKRRELRETPVTVTSDFELGDVDTHVLPVKKGAIRTAISSKKLLPPFLKTQKNSLEKTQSPQAITYATKRGSRWQAKAAAAIIKARKGAHVSGARKKPAMRPLSRKGRTRQPEKEVPLQNLKPIPEGVTIKPAAAHAAWHKVRMKPIFTWPLDPAHFWVSSQFGMRKCAGKWALHAGVDLAAARGTPIRAAAGGTVLKATCSPGYGNYILIEHGKNFQTRYAHLDKILVRTGQKVNVGDYIGRVGATGFVRKSRRGSSGAHLHFEIYYKGKAMNPFKFLA